MGSVTTGASVAAGAHADKIMDATTNTETSNNSFFIILLLEK